MRTVRLVEGNGYAERVLTFGDRVTVSCTWMTQTTVCEVSQDEADRLISDHRAAGCAVEEGQTDVEPVVNYDDGWRLAGMQYSTQTHTTPSGSWQVEILRREMKETWQGLFFRYRYAVTFLSDDGRRVEFTKLDGGTWGEVVQYARWAESVGLVKVEQPVTQNRFE